PGGKATTVVPAAETGVAPAGQPLAVTTLTSGISDLSGLGKVGSAPMPAVTGRRADAPQEMSAQEIITDKTAGNRPFLGEGRVGMLHLAFGVGVARHPRFHA